MAEVRVVRPQEGYQMKALSSPADIVIGGGAAGSGKTYSLLLDPLRDVKTPGFGGVIFRRTTPQIRNQGGLWDTSMDIYSHAKAIPRESTLEWIFEYGVKIKFSHLEYEKDIFNWQGSQIPFIGFDELTHFTKKMFFYLLSRNRSVCGVKPYVRATCNPDPESWVAKFIEWWIDQETGFPIPERDGVLRYMVMYGDEYVWGDSKEEVIEKSWSFLQPVVEKAGVDPRELVKSVTFVSGTIYENKALLNVNPAYLGNLMAQDEDTRSQLLDGNWKVKISDIDIYDYYAFLGAFENKYTVQKPGRYITADIALEGSDKFVLGYWNGRILEDIEVWPKTDGKQVVDKLVDFAKRHQVQNRHIVFDADGVGGFIEGFIKGAIPFNGNSSPREVIDPMSGKKIKENYKNLKAQCVYRSGKAVKEGEIQISEHVANKMYDDKMTIRQRFMHERKAIKRYKNDEDGKLCINPKSEQKIVLGGESPDLMDMFMMREMFELVPKRSMAAA
jgi:hypothetical protein